MLEEERKLTRCRRTGARSGSRAGGGLGARKAVGRQARSGGSKSREFGAGGWCMLAVLLEVITVVLIVVLYLLEKLVEVCSSVVLSQGERINGSWVWITCKQARVPFVGCTTQGLAVMFLLYTNTADLYTYSGVSRFDMLLLYPRKHLIAVVPSARCARGQRL